ncbi:MAG TPA: hypothetical protein VF502_09795 [Stellaceae bacterium]
MHGSRNEPVRRLGLAALLLLLAAAAPGRAQPVPLTTPAPAAEAAVPESTPDTPANKAGEPPIQATPLAPVDPAWVGTLADAAHPLPQTMWQGTPRALVAAALPRLAPTTSPTLRDLARRLLLSNAEAPQGPDMPDRPNLAALRVERLMALGEVDGALALLDALPMSLRNDDLDRDRVELYFAKNDAQTACREVHDGVGRHQGVWWDRALIACQALAGDQAKAALGLGLLHEQQAPADPVFDALIRALGGRPAKLDKLPEPRPMLMTLLAAAKLPLPADAVAAADPSSLRGWADNAAVPPLQRLAAAERAASLGAIPPAALADLYAKVEVKPEELGAAIKHGKAPATARDRAVLFHVARTDPAPGARAGALQALLADARKRGDFITMAQVVAPIISELTPSPEIARFAPDAARALYAAGRADAAKPWLDQIDPATAPLLPALARLAPGIGAWEAALVNPSSPEDSTPLTDATHEAQLPNAAVWMAQERAAAAKRVGETVLMTLLIARVGDRLSAEPIVLNRAIEGLKAVGLDAEARALALEAALAAAI